MIVNYKQVKCHDQNTQSLENYFPPKVSGTSYSKEAANDYVTQFIEKKMRAMLEVNGKNAHKSVHRCTVFSAALPYLYHRVRISKMYSCLLKKVKGVSFRLKSSNSWLLITATTWINVRPKKFRIVFEY